MLYRLDTLDENSINPITGKGYDGSWIILILTDSEDYQYMCGSSNGCAYTIKVSRSKIPDWKMAVGDFMGFSEANGKNAILVIAEEDLIKDNYNLEHIVEEYLQQRKGTYYIMLIKKNVSFYLKRHGQIFAVVHHLVSYM